MYVYVTLVALHRFDLLFRDKVYLDLLIAFLRYLYVQL